MYLLPKPEPYYSVYMLENKITGKRYIGQTGKDPQERWNNGRGYKDCDDLYEDIKKYGWIEGFKHIILGVCKTREEALSLEGYYIDLYKTVATGYNRHWGDINYDLIEGIVKDSSPYEIICKKKSMERLPIKLCDKTIQKIKDGRNIRIMRGRIITEPALSYVEKFIKDIGYSWYRLPHGLIYYKKWLLKDKVKYVITSNIGNFRQISDKKFTDNEIREFLYKNNIFGLIGRYYNKVKEFQDCEKWYKKNEMELNPFYLIRVCFCHFNPESDPFIYLQFNAPITRKYIMRFLGIDNHYLETKPVEVIKRLSIPGTFEKFLEFGDSVGWVL